MATSPEPAAADTSTGNINVAIRVRPPSTLELSEKDNIIVHVNTRENSVQVDGDPNERFCNHVLWSVPDRPTKDGRPAIGQSEVYQLVGTPVLQHALSGYNACVLAYGQTGSGKTYSMMGDMASADVITGITEQTGLIPRLCLELFERLNNGDAAGAKSTSPKPQHAAGTPTPTCDDPNDDIVPKQRYRWKCVATYVEIYCEKISDLLHSEPNPKKGAGGGNAQQPTPREGAGGGKEIALKLSPDASHFVLVGATEVPVKNLSEVLRVIHLGNRTRHVAATRMNERSSRSHAIFTLNLTHTLYTTLPNGKEASAPRVHVSLKLVDLAGSERQKEAQTGDGVRRVEANAINLSLMTLGLVIEHLWKRTNQKRSAGAAAGGNATPGAVPHAPYRDSVLTKLLKDSIGGNSRTTMIATISPCESCRELTKGTLRYAARARCITNRAVISEDPRAAELSLHLSLVGSAATQLRQEMLLSCGTLTRRAREFEQRYNDAMARITTQQDELHAERVQHDQQLLECDKAATDREAMLVRERDDARFECQLLREAQDDAVENERKLHVRIEGLEQNLLSGLDSGKLAHQRVLEALTLTHVAPLQEQLRTAMGLVDMLKRQLRGLGHEPVG